MIILLLENLYILDKSSTKSFLKKKTLFSKILAFFEKERDGMTDDELNEIEQAVSRYYG